MISVWPPLPPSALVAGRATELPFPLGERTCRVFALGRHALYAGVRAVGLGHGDEILVPDYHHGSEIEALERAGLVCVFYALGEDLEPDEDEVDALRTDRTRALLLIHPFGVPVDAGRWRRACDERGLLLVEDAAQGWLGRREGEMVGRNGHVSIVCLYKTFGVPDGAALWLDPVLGVDAPAVEGPAGSGAMALTRRGAAAFLQPFPGPLRPPHAPFVSSEAFAVGRPRPASHATAWLLPRLAESGVARRRRANYERLRMALGDQTTIEAPPALEGAAPFVFPFATTRKQETLDALRRDGIRGLDFWSVAHPSLKTPGPTARALRSQVVGLPVHQELREHSRGRVVRSLRRCAPTEGRPFDAELRTSLEPLAGWDALAAAADNMFSTWEWCSTWWRHFGRGRRVALVSCRLGDELKAILPLYQARTRPLSVFRFMGYGTADDLRPICAPGDAARALGALRDVLARPALRCDVFFADQQPAAVGAGRALNARKIKEIPALKIETGGRTWEEFLTAKSRGFRQQARRVERRLERDHEVAYRLADDPATLEHDLETLFELHAARWGGSSFLDERAFHEAFAPRALGNGWLRLWIQEIDGTPSAAWYGFRFGSADYYYQSGWDPRWAQYSVGFALLLHTIRDAIEGGAQEYRFLRGGEAYKWRLASRSDLLETVGLPLTPAGAACVSLAAAAPEVERRYPVVYARLADLSR